MAGERFFKGAVAIVGAMVFSFLRTRAGWVLALRVDGVKFHGPGLPGVGLEGVLAVQELFKIKGGVRGGVLKTEKFAHR